MHRVAVNLANSTFRRRRAERRARVRAVDTSWQESPDIAAYISIRDGVRELSPKRRQAVLFRHVAGLSVSETASAMGLTENAVRSLTSRGLAELRDVLIDTKEGTHA